MLGEHGGRRRRENPKRKREEIYCYDEERLELSDHELDAYIEPSDVEDDSFIYEGNKIKKVEVKKKKIKGKIENDLAHLEFVSFVNPPGKPKPELKIFNPESYHENLVLKEQYEEELDSIYSKFGSKKEKLSCVTPMNRWRFLLKQVEESAVEFAAERDERIKLRRKVAKFSQGAFNRLEGIQEQRVKEEEKRVRRIAQDLEKHVMREFWGNALKVKKVAESHYRQKQEKEAKMKKLEELVSRQFEASQTITEMLEGYKEVSLENVIVSQSTRVPVIIDIRRKPKCEYLGLHEDQVIRQSLLVKFPLREYQLLGVYWISTLQERGMNAILADEMGLGKTIQTIALLAHLAIEKGIWGPHLIIVPTTILLNWEIEFKRWCPAFKIMTYFGTTKERKLKRKGWSKLNTFHVCITSYRIAVTDHPVFRRKKWYYMILDEAHNIKNFKSQRWQTLLHFNTHSRLLLTGTPLQNDLTELWSLLHFLMPQIFNSFDDFNEWFNIPFQEALEKNFPISQEILKKLHTVLRPFFLRRLKKDVETQLPKKTECIVRCAMSRRQKYLYDEMIWHENRKQKTHQTAGMLNVLMNLKKICNHPDLFQPRIEESPLAWVPPTIVIPKIMFLKGYFEEQTPFLREFVEPFTAKFENIAEDLLKKYAQTELTKDNTPYYINKYRDRLLFAHVNYERSKRKELSFYFFSKTMEISKITPIYEVKSIEDRIEEMEEIFNKFLFVVPRAMARPAHLATCPMSSEVQAEGNRVAYLSKELNRSLSLNMQSVRNRFLLHFPNKNNVLYDSGKLVKMALLLKSIKYRGLKTLIFTQMTRMLDIFEKVLNMFKFNYVRLDGNTPIETRQAVVERFNNDPRVLCFISSTRSGGIGLNLIGASNVIFYDTDWNPAMDKQAQDRCHRIGQTRDVTIYRLITEYSIEENILMKSIQKRKLESLVTEEGMFDTSYFEKVSLKGLLEGAIQYSDDVQADLAAAEDEEDREMLHKAEKDRNEEDQEEIDFSMLPPLFNYGLKMLDHDLVIDEEKEGEKEEEKEEDKEEEILSENEKGIENEEEEKNIEEDEEIDEEEKIFEENVEKEIHSTMTTLEKLKAMSIYQTQYLFMKKYFYQQETAPIGEVTTEEQNNYSKKKRNRRKKK